MRVELLLQLSVRCLKNLIVVENYFLIFFRILIVAFFSRLLDRRTSCLFRPSSIIIRAVLGGIDPRLSANMVTSFTSRVESSASLKWMALVLRIRLKATSWLL